jgi:hypothetical protein
MFLGWERRLKTALTKPRVRKMLKAGKWLASNEGSMWLLESVDRIVEAIGGGMGTTFAPGIKAKL